MLFLYKACNTYPKDLNCKSGRLLIKFKANQLIKMEVNQPEKPENLAALKHFYELVMDGIISISQTGIIESVNPAIHSLFGYTSHELIGNPVHIIIPQFDKADVPLLATQLDDFLEKPQEVKCRKKDGTLFIALLNVNQMEAAGRKKYTAIVHDISELRNAQAALRKRK